MLIKSFCKIMSDCLMTHTGVICTLKNSLTPFQISVSKVEHLKNRVKIVRI